MSFMYKDFIYFKSYSQINFCAKKLECSRRSDERMPSYRTAHGRMVDSQWPGGIQVSRSVVPP